MNKNIAFDIYNKELEILNTLKTKASAHVNESTELYSDFLFLINQYEKLLNRTVKITAISDSQHLKLIETQNKLIDINQELEKLSVTDNLTGLYNRLKFNEITNNEMSRCNRYGNSLSFIISDIDFFKQINDSFGHNFGDKILVSFSKILKDNIRNTDIAARWGGEEFVILLPETKKEEGAKIAEKLREFIEKTIFTPAGKVTASFGVSEYLPGTTAEAFIENADKNLYIAKNGGRNRVVY